MSNKTISQSIFDNMSNGSLTFLYLPNVYIYLMFKWLILVACLVDFKANSLGPIFQQIMMVYFRLVYFIFVYN